MESNPDLALFFYLFCLQRGKQSQQSQPDQSAELGEGTAMCISTCSHTAEISSWHRCHKCDVYVLQLLLILSAFGNLFWYFSRIWEIFLRHREILGPALTARGWCTPPLPPPLSSDQAVIPELAMGKPNLRVFHRLFGCETALKILLLFLIFLKSI